MVNFDRVRDEILASEPERATGIAIAALAQVIQCMVLSEALDHDDKERLARQAFNIAEPEQSDCQ
tara:strand:- start:19078 stop:19272 length:195 start_codon:yes stop_codon:yes gene_type:complete